MLESIGPDDIRPGGELAFRGKLNLERLEGDAYSEGALLAAAEESDWPGDLVGRWLLGRTLIGRVLGRQPGIDSERLPSVLAGLPATLNERGHLGRVYPRGVLSEQQVSGHGWLLRGLAEQHLATGEQAPLDLMNGIAEGLLLPARGRYADYPLQPGRRGENGAPAGSIVEEEVDGWLLSTDVGCAFLALEGIVQAWQLLDRPELRELIEEMIERFLEMDPLVLGAQTHATLSALRGLIRYHEAVDRASLLGAARHTYEIYKSRAMTANYANHNWFGRPEWTEPCAVVDSLLLAVSLWRHTRESAYLHDAHHIYYNALCHGQRPNGGFGCDSCAGADGPFLEPKLYEATHCCTMRGAVGLAAATRSTIFQDGDCVALPFFFDCRAMLQFADGQCRIELESGYPYQGSLTLRVNSSCAEGEKAIHLFAPEWMPNESIQLRRNGRAVAFGLSAGFVVVHVPLQEGDRLQMTASLQQRPVPSPGANSAEGYHCFHHGPLVLGCSPESEVRLARDAELVRLHKARYEAPGRTVVLAPINNLIRMPEDVARSSRRQILFR